jgi:hypothetical protein
MDDAPAILTAVTDADVPAIAELMNIAYRGRGSDAGWTTEADYFQGKRTAAAENWVRERDGREIRMTVVNVRDTLIASVRTDQRDQAVPLRGQSIRDTQARRSALRHTS